MTLKSEVSNLLEIAIGGGELIVDIKFNKRFLKPILCGKKTTTLRRSPKGNVGDMFIVGTHVYRLIRVNRLTTMLDILSEWTNEGFDSAGDMMIWLEVNDYKPPLYLHTFTRMGRIQCFSGSYYLEHDKLPDGPLKVDDIEQFQGLYLLNNGNILEAHEWMDPQWDELIEPFGSIYYDIYDPSAVTA